MTRLRARVEEMVRIFSRSRDRAALLLPLASWFTTVEFVALESLTPPEQRAVNHFYEALGALRWYLEFTEDMPLQVQSKLTLAMRGLEENHVALVAAIGAVEDEGQRVVTAHVVSKTKAR